MMSRISTVIFLMLLSAGLLATAACDRDATGDTASATAAPNAAPAASQPAAMETTRPTATEVARVVFLGDSLTAGLGVEADQAFPALLEQQLNAAGTPVRVVNAGVSGDTTAGGLRRLDWLLRQKPQVLVVGLGANDGLRGLDVPTSEQNLRQIVTKAQSAGVRVLLLGMLIPPNYGPEYATQFREVYPRLAKELNVPLVPFVLEGVGGEAQYNQADGIHPTAPGHRIIAQNVLPYLQPLLTK